MPEFTFDTVFGEELMQIAERRIKQDRPPVDIHSLPDTRLALAGLALSGGGIRSATFSLGVVQSLLSHKVFGHFDYLSTVSGGGYLGACLSNWYAQTQQSTADPPLYSAIGRADPPGIAHLRDHSSYLAPGGRSKAFTFGLLVSLGLFINILLILPILIVIAILFQLYATLGPLHLGNPFTYFLAGFAAIALSYAIIISNFASARRQDYHRTVMLRVAMVISVVLGIFAFLAIQKPLVDFLYRIFSTFDLRQTYVTIAGSIGIVGVFISVLRNLIARFAVYITKFWRYGLGLLAPLLVWYVILLIEVTLQQPCAWLAFEHAFNLHVLQFVHDNLWPPGLNELRLTCFPPHGIYYGSYYSNDVCRIALIYLMFASVVGAIAFFINVNSTSLNSFYRDRLQDAYLFNFPRDPTAGTRERLSINRGLRLTQLDNSGPYHIINAAVNIQRSKFNLRGRNADFFVFSRLFVGGEITGYCPTRDIEQSDSKLDLATATAISGAAVAPNQGVSTKNYTLRFFMALVNARLGYWLVNPRKLAQGTRVTQNVSPYYFFLELIGALDEEKRRIYLSDGGHIENLGVYQLLRRRCKFIVVCDAEWDPKREFHGLSHAMRLAYIDLGVMININLTDLRINNGRSLAHCAIGQIDYGNGQLGTLLYIKPSITGNESEYIYEYLAKNSTFPHETTTDQFFTEPQFEAYRALGYHSVEELFRNRVHEIHEWFGGIIGVLYKRPMDSREYLNVQRRIVEIETERADQRQTTSRETQVLKQLHVIETAVLSLKMLDPYDSIGPYKNLVNTFNRWTGERDFWDHWQTVRHEFGDAANRFVDGLRSSYNIEDTHTVPVNEEDDITHERVDTAVIDGSQSLIGASNEQDLRVVQPTGIASAIFYCAAAIFIFGIQRLGGDRAARGAKRDQGSLRAGANAKPSREIEV